MSVPNKPQEAISIPVTGKHAAGVNLRSGQWDARFIVSVLGPVYILAQFGLGLCSSVTVQNYIVEIAAFDTTGLIRLKDHVLFHRNSAESA
jgi:hypothetical protein